METARAIAYARECLGYGWHVPPAVVEALLAELDRAREVEARARLYVAVTRQDRGCVPAAATSGEARSHWLALLRTLGVKP